MQWTVIRPIVLGLFLLGTEHAFAANSQPADGSKPAPAQADDYKKPLLLIPRTIAETTLSSPAGHPHRIVVSAPQGGEPKGSYPVIYVLDGDGWMGAAVDVAKMREYEKLDPAIIVGIGYASHSFFDAIGRSYDFSPPGSVDSDFDGVPLGGADDFLQFMNATVKPWIASHYHADSRRQILFGHSMVECLRSTRSTRRRRVSTFTSQRVPIFRSRITSSATWNRRSKPILCGAIHVYW